ncbi:MAG: hypothetical protein WBF73_20340 [Bradyrhizobium sp.]
MIGTTFFAAASIFCLLAIIRSSALALKHDRDNPSLWAAGSVFLDGPDHAEKS